MSISNIAACLHSACKWERDLTAWKVEIVAMVVSGHWYMETLLLSFKVISDSGSVALSTLVPAACCHWESCQVLNLAAPLSGASTPCPTTSVTSALA